MPETVRVEVELSDEFLGDVMVTMVESGYDALFYWDGFEMLNVERTGGELSVKQFTFSTERANSDELFTMTITGKDVARGIRLILDRTVGVGYPRKYIVDAVMQGDAGCIDATAADCIAQALAFAGVVYG